MQPWNLTFKKISKKYTLCCETIHFIKDIINKISLKLKKNSLLPSFSQKEEIEPYKTPSAAIRSTLLPRVCITSESKKVIIDSHSSLCARNHYFPLKRDFLTHIIIAIKSIQILLTYLGCRMSYIFSKALCLTFQPVKRSAS